MISLDPSHATLSPARKLAKDWDMAAGLKEKEEGMRELVRRAEAREAAAKQQLSDLMSERLQLMQVSTRDGNNEGAQNCHITSGLFGFRFYALGIRVRP